MDVKSLIFSTKRILYYAFFCALMMLLFLTTNSFAQGTGLEDAVSIWLFNEGSGNIAFNEVYGEPDGDLVGNPSWVEGLYGTGLQFDGVDDAVEVASNPLIDAHSLTVQAYIKPTYISDYSDEPSAKIFNIALERPEEGIDRFMFEIVLVGGGWGFSHFMSIAGNRSEPEVLELAEHPFDEWYHLALVFDSVSTEEVRIKHYVDHILEIDTLYAFGSLNQGEVFIGERYVANSVGSRCYYEGIMDNLVLHNKALMPEEFMPVPSEIGIDDNEIGLTPELFTLEQNYPNPFNPVTFIKYSLDLPQYVKLSVYNLNGQLINVLENGYKSSGTHIVRWDSRDASIRALTTGIYFYKLETDVGYYAIKKAILLR